MRRLLTLAVGLLGVQAGVLGQAPSPGGSPAVVMADIPAGSFVMGSDDAPIWDQKPAHNVEITRPFRMSTTEITLDQYRQFKPDWTQASPDGFVIGVSWYDAAAFCNWLGRKENKAYRLPTEAEWEYVRRSADGWGVQNMTNGVREWCLDWYGEYAAPDARDPVGPAAGMARAVRGGVLDKLDGKNEVLPRSEYDQPAYRAGLPPAFGLMTGANQDAAAANTEALGAHAIGFRIVQGEMPMTAPTPVAPPFAQQGVKQGASAAHIGPDSTKPHFRKRFLLPSPPETETDWEKMAAHQKRIDAAGLDPSFRGHNHSPALEACDNGDLLCVFFTSYTEYEPEMSLMATRLRFGADTWEMPSRFVDCPGVCDNTPLLWNDQGKLYLFWAWTRAIGAYPFQWMASGDNGAAWDETRFPQFTGPIGPHSRQPINRAFRGADGTVYVPSDAVGGASVLWASRDNMATWRDTLGRSAGRHTVYCTLKDGRILAMGGKNTDIDGFMPKACSSDSGQTWQVSKSSFPALAVNQRPSLLRLQSGRLFFAADFQKHKGVRPEGATAAGCFAALSEDEGETWRIKKLPGVQEHENGAQFFGDLPGAATLGYSVARQAPNGLIHLITTMNRPCLHFEMNEAWILADTQGNPTDQDLMRNTAQSIHDVRQYAENYPDGKPRLTWSAGAGDDGRYLLQGAETWYYPDGRKQYEAQYELGRKAGMETLWRTDGSKQWEWEHRPNGESRWTQWWENGNKKAESMWKDFHAMGIARTWRRTGELALEMDLTAP